jgi:protein-disulfide isomerase
MREIVLSHQRSKNMPHLSTLRRIGLAGFILLCAVTAYSAPAKPNWLLTFTVSEKGSHIIGNPAASTKVVEYMSYTCGHCANFETNDAPTFKNQYVANGKTNLEIRNFVLNPVDLTAAMLARCGGKGRFFGNHKHLLATQKTLWRQRSLFGNHKHLLATQKIWLGNASKISKATDAKLQTEDYVGYMTGVYVETGLSNIMQQRGVSLAQGKTCLADKTAFNTIVAMSDEGAKLGVHGTPTFMVNGTLDGEVHDFQALKSKLSAT